MNRQTESGPKHRRKSSVLRRCRKTVSDVDEVTLDGRLFHTREAETGNARSPMVGWHVDGTTSIDVDADLSHRRESKSATLCNSSARYSGAVKCRQRYVSTANLNSICCGTRSQCRSQSSGLTASCFLVEKNNRAAAFSYSQRYLVVGLVGLGLPLT